VSRWIRGTSDQAWSDLFTSYQRSAYRLEGQQIYSSPMEDEVLDRFRQGLPLDLDLSFPASRAQAQAERGTTLTTVRVVVEPPTDYTRLELVVYPHLAKIGDDIRIIAVPEGSWPEGLPRHDYWLFDERDVWRMHYHDTYRFAGAELVEDDSAVNQYLEWRDIALSLAVPLDDYLGARQTE
jgi:hypothetical protein